MKKLSIFIFVLLLVGLICVQVSFAAKDQIVWKFSISNEQNDPTTIALQKYLCDEVFDKTNGGLKIEIYPSFVLGAERDSTQLLQDGSIEVMVQTLGILSTFVPEFNFLTLPFIFDNREHFRKFKKTDLWKNLTAKTQEKGIILFGTNYTGERIPVFRTKPVTKAEDFKGLKIRVMENKMQINTVKALGAIPVTLPFPEIYSSLQHKVVDGMFNDADAINRISAYEVAPYLTNLPFFVSVMNLSVSKIAFEKLPEEYQNVVREIFVKNYPKIGEIEYQYNYNIYQKIVMEDFPFFNNIFDLSSFREAVKSVYDDLEKTYPGTKKYIDAIKALK